MRRSSGPRKTAHLSESVHQQLNMYALAATAAGVGMLAMTLPAEAKIVYTPAVHIISNHGRYFLDLNHDGKADFVLWVYSFCNTDFCRSQLLVRPIGEGLGAEGRYQQSTGWGWAYALNKGSRIGRGHPFSAKYMVAAFGSGTCTGEFWCDVKNRYLGLKFEAHGETHYGWARLSINVTSVITATLTGYAYETIPGKAIIAGATKEPDNGAQPTPASIQAHTPRPATLGRLALGAPGLSIWRREQPAVAAPESN